MLFRHPRLGITPLDQVKEFAPAHHLIDHDANLSIVDTISDANRVSVVELGAH